MAKTIKFNLICDDKPVRTMEDLQENFSVEDVLKYYENGLLCRWLEVRGYEEEKGKVLGIQSKESLDIAKELIKIFGIETDEKKIEEGVYMLKFLEESKELCEIYQKNKFNVKKIIDDYQVGYKQLVDGILENPDDIALIKAHITEIVENYPWALKLDHREVFWTLYGKGATLAIMCLLMNEKSRNYYLPYVVETDEETGKTVYDIEENSDKKRMYQYICDLVKTNEVEIALGDNLHIFAGVTDGYWKDLETKGKKYMIISMGEGDYVRAAGVQGGDLSCADVVGSFMIIDGIDYKSNSSARRLLYMEV